MLERINKTNDIKKLTISEKNILSSEIREYLLDVVSKNGGHLASNLGVVELTIALESVFDLNKDKVVWDVGHQSYVHKILTGRKEELKHVRNLNCISGFPKTNESKTDCFNTGHSSTSISAAEGMAVSRDLNKKNYNVIAIIGDGALTGGMAIEALNHVASIQEKMIIILNDNEMSISSNIGGINNLLTRLRSKKTYHVSNNYIKKIVSKIPILGKLIIYIIASIKKVLKELIIPGMYFEEIGIRYLGPIDGHNIEELEHILTRVKDLDGPTLIHIRTKKGKGYKYAEENPDKYHSTSKFDISTGKPLSPKKTDYSKVFGDNLISLAKKNKKIVAITAAMKDGTGLTEFAKKYPNRFFDVGIAEQHALTFAAGMAKEGLIPFVTIYSSFYQRAYDQVIHDVCMQNLHVIMCVDRAGIVGQDGETHQGIFDLSFFKLIPNIVIMSPKDFNELGMMMSYATELNCPVVIRYPRGTESKQEYPLSTKIQLGKSEIIKQGNYLTIISIGNKVSIAKSISDKLNNISIEVINVRFLKPLDKKVIIKSLNKTKKVIVIEDNTIIGGLSSSIKELITEENIKMDYQKYYAYNDIFVEHGTPTELEHKYKVDEEHIIKDILKEYNK